jgi:peptidoglycan/LPS O-acetylase OafA/YrhL
MRREYIKALDGVRGFAASLVIYGHTVGVLGKSQLSIFSIAAKSGVYVFFVLSAFLLTRQFLDTPLTKKNIAQNISEYFFRRCARILPLYYFVVTFCYLISLLSTKKVIIFGFDEYAQSIFLYKGFGHFWTIPIEFGFYFLLPVICLIALHCPRRMVYPGILAFILISMRAFPAPDTFGLIPLLYVFLAGSLIALVEHDLRSIPPEKMRMMMVSLDVLAIVVVVGFLFVSPLLKESFQINYSQIEDLRPFWTVMAGVALGGVILGSGVIRRFFEFKAFCFLGRISYSAYLWHVIILYAVRDAAIVKVPWINSLLAWLLICAVGFVSYHVFETRIYRSVLLKRAWGSLFGRWL